MNWKFWRTEKRSSGYTDLIVNALVQAAESNVRNASATSALEAASGIYASAFQCARHNGPGALTPSMLGNTARRLIRHGEAVFLIDVRKGNVELTECSSWTITGDYKNWFYKVEIPAPTNSIGKKVSADSVLHFRYSNNSLEPWQGIGPLGHASLTGSLAGTLENKIEEESKAASALIVPVPQDGGSGEEGDPLAPLKADLKNAKGSVMLTETTAGGWAEGMANAPRRDWVQNRIGPDIPETLSKLRAEVFADVLKACLVPVSLFTDADGTSQRESWRRFVMGSVEPLSRRIGEEIERKLEVESLDFDFRSMWAHDLTGRASAYKALTGAGMPEADARTRVGL